MKMKNYVIAMLLLVLLSVNTFAALTADINSISIIRYPLNTSIGSTLYAGVGLTCQVNSSDNATSVANHTYIQAWRDSTLVRTFVFNATDNNTLLNFTYFALSSETAKGQVWRCGALVTDVAGINSSWTNKTAYAIYNNTAPTVSPSISRSSNTLTCITGYSDADSDAIGIQYYIWYKSASAISGQTSSTLDVSTYVTGDTFNCSVKAEDSGYGPILNSTVVMSSVYTLSGTCIFGNVNSYYNIVDMCVVIKVFTDLATFIQNAMPVLITVFVLVITLGAVLSLVAALLYMVFETLKGSFGGMK
jgi:hypothetical protein